MTDFTAYIGDPDYEAAAIAWEKQYEKMAEDGFNAHAIVDAALAGMETVELTEATRFPECPNHAPDEHGTMCARRLVGPWEPVEE